MFGLGGAAMPGGPPFQAGNQFVIQIAHMQVSRHSDLHEDIDINDLISGTQGSSRGIRRSACAGYRASTGLTFQPLSSTTGRAPASAAAAKRTVSRRVWCGMSVM